MGPYLIKRLALGLLVMLGVVVASFLLLSLVPGDPALIVAGPTAPPETVEAIRRQLGLDLPLWTQFLRYLARLGDGDLGTSIVSRSNVSSEIGRAFIPTLELVMAAGFWSVLCAVPLGVISAVRRGSWLDRGGMVAVVVGAAMPIFWIGLVLIWLVSFKLRWLPVSGRGGPVWTAIGLPFIILPAVTLGSILLGPLARLTRSSMLEVLGAQFVVTARAKGLPEKAVIYKHALRNGLLSVVTIMGLQFGHLLGGAVVTETIFSWPGMGRLMVGAILSKDFPLVQGLALVMALVFVMVNLLVDLVYAHLDPRINLG